MSFNQPPFGPSGQGVPPGMPPVPRDHDQVTMSEMMPFRSGKISLVRSPLLVLLGITALLGPLMFGAIDLFTRAQTTNDQAAAFSISTLGGVFISVMLLSLLVYFYARPGRTIWSYIWTFGVPCLILATPIAYAYFIPFRNILPGNVGGLTPQSGFPATFIAHFFGAGMCEELMKATGTLAVAWMTIMATRKGTPLPPLLHFLRVRGPLDGVLMGVFAGAGFIFMETAFEYVPNIAAQVAQQTGDRNLGFMLGLQLLLPRVFTGMVGHMAWAGIFGYFIGLAVIRPASAPKLMGIGWVAASLTHGLWNSTAMFGTLASMVIAGITAVVVGAMILKARQLNQKMFGDGPDTFGSIVIDRSGGAPQPAYPPAYPPAAAPQPAYAPQPAVAPQPEPAPTPGFQTYAPPPPAPAVEPALAIEIGGLLIPIRADVAIILSDEPALSGRGAGVRADVVPHPTRPGVLGLRNAGEKPWIAQLRDGRIQQIERDQNLRMAAGVRLEFGDGLIGNVVVRG